MVAFLDELFEGWTSVAFIVWIGMSLGIIYVAWFVPIPSLLSFNIFLINKLSIYL